ncbi:polysaccharide deacetylase family protein [Thiomicrospira microaerophila]|uniref:polysaccharide deacetylase family protein n=1 Tax=Thiomicrospira microaerophila TaxID=406020 RepID=UPI00200FA2FB|nr:polysaccharide deacetylase family protein [Thiomicrospira microaerophila]UQB42804.1 polysaccharide deacetylase family protein [Thiomicrospira microaerophila]
MKLKSLAQTFNYLILLTITTHLLLPKTLYAGSSSAVILMYHHFGDETPPSTSVTLEQFDAHLDYLQHHQFNVWPLSKLIHHWETNQLVPERTVVLTADDAYISVYTEAYPRLTARGWSMTTFVNSEPIDRGFGNFMTWQQMREMQAAGFEFANHSHTHSKMRRIEGETEAEMLARVRQEIDIAQQRLNTELGAENVPRLFAYPYGEYSESAANLIAEMGYISVAQVSGAVDANSDRRALNRFPMAVNFAKIEDFRLKVNTRPLPLKSVTPWDPIVGENPPTLTLELSKPVRQLNCFNSRGQALNMDWQTPTRLVIQSEQALRSPRDRYACTAPIGQGHWYWFGHLWVID